MDQLTTSRSGTLRNRPEESQAPDAWTMQWKCVPPKWARGSYRLDQSPFRDVFVRNTNYLRSKKNYEFVSPAYARIRDECSWWLWSIWADGSRKVDPAMLTWWGRAITAMADQRVTFAGGVTNLSVADFNPKLVVREALHEFWSRNGRYPSTGNTRNLESVAHSIFEHVNARCTDAPWWARDTWNLRLDPRIPRRPNEPHADRIIHLARIEPNWLREGVRYWLSQTLTLDMYTWTTAYARATNVGIRFGAFAEARGITHPAIAETLPALRATFMDYLAVLRSPQSTRSGRAMTTIAANACKTHVQAFYTFMSDNADAAAAFTGDPRWAELNVNHTRLWAPGHTPKRQTSRHEARYYTDTEIGRLLAHLPVLATPTHEFVTIEHEGTTRALQGVGDPQAARIWQLQALTGRRASEICMLDRQPLTMIFGDGQPAGEHDPDAYVARLQYQQTKVDDVDPTILVTQDVVTIIEEQQAWLAEHRPEAAEGPYLFVQLRGNTRGLNPRSYRSYADALRRLSQAVTLTDDSGKPLAYTETHRLRHTRATRLLNDGVPVHVLQRYLGHRSPEMSMRYAQTLDSTAREAFLKHKQVGADGREINIAPLDLLELQQLDRRADRALPNGLCLLPPTKTCDKGNACLPCGSFTTDASYLDEHKMQRERSAALIRVRQKQFEERHGTRMPDTNTWLQGRLRELASLDAIIVRLEANEAEQGSVKGAGTAGKTTALTLTDDPITRDAARQALTDRLNTDTRR